MITLMAPLLRLGVALDSSREQKVQEVTCHQSSGGATITVKGTGDLDLEIWAAERAADLFRQASGANLAIQKQRR